MLNIVLTRDEKCIMSLPEFHTSRAQRRREPIDGRLARVAQTVGEPAKQASVVMSSERYDKFRQRRERSCGWRWGDRRKKASTRKSPSRTKIRATTRRR